MTDNTQPEALRLAIEFADCVKLHAIPSINDITAAGRELRRLHAENATLQSGYDAAWLEIEALHARVQELERERDGYKAVCDEWLDKTEWVQQTLHPRELGMHRADVLRERLLAAAPKAAPVAQGDARAEQSLLKVLTAVQRYLPPDGPSAKDTLSEIIGIVDPWPLGDLKGKA